MDTPPRRVTPSQAFDTLEKSRGGSTWEAGSGFASENEDDGGDHDIWMIYISVQNDTCVLS